MNEEDIFHEALAKPTPEDRAVYLDQACAGQPQLRAAVEALLQAHAGSSGFLAKPAAAPRNSEDFGLGDSATSQPCPPAEGPGTRIGPYKLLEPIGEGGMGTVWMAEQQESVRRTVALKVIKAGLDTRQVVARFEAERQALALMDHPHIAKVLDAGTTENGRPYFVMELVKGVAITKYCDERRLTPRQRLELFIPVCRAVQHAHQKGVIHRDLKPSNVLVAAYDGKPVPKVIDFGVAKATGQQLTERTLFTGFGHLVGTLEYMSPEQAEFNALDIDTRSDIYSLGVLLYELLTGTTPLTKQRLKEAALAEVLRVIREEEPPKPSTRLAASKDSLASVSAQRQMEPAQLAKLVRGELDWIVMKALEKDRGRRYDTANGFAQDIERYLRDEPVQAGPPSALYRFRKFARRKKAMLLTASALAVAVVLAVAALAVSTMLTARANRDLHRALERERQNAYEQRIALAEREWGVNNLSRMQQLLDECPTNLRGWEWHYLKRLPRQRELAPMRHDGAIFGVALSPSGERIAAASRDGAVKLWDARTGLPVWSVVAHTDHARSVAFSPDGRWLASGGWDGTVKVWEAETGQPRATLPAGSTATIAFSPEGQRLASAGSDPTVKVWDVRTGELSLTLHGHTGGVHSVAFSADGNRIVSGGADQSVRVWDAIAGQELHTFRGHRQEIWGVAFSPDGQLVASGGGSALRQTDSELKVWDLRTGQELHSLRGHTGWVACTAFSPDGRLLASGGRDQNVKLWDVATGREILTLRGHIENVRGLAFSADGHRLVSAGHDRTVLIWDATPLSDSAAPNCLTLEGHGDAVNSVAFSPRDPRVLASGGADGTVRLWDAASGKPLHSFRAHTRSVQGLAFSPDGDLLVTAGGNNNLVTVWKATTGKEVKALGVHKGGPLVVAFGKGNQVVSGGYGNIVRVWDVGTGRHRALVNHNWVVHGVAFHPHGPLLASASSDGTVRLWDLTTDKEIASSPLVHGGAVRSVAFSPDGERLATAGTDRTLRLWETRTWKPLPGRRNLPSEVWSVAFGPDGKRLAWGGTDATVNVWDPDSDELHTLRGHTNWVRSVAFSPDDKQIASASADGTVRIWEAPPVAAHPAGPAK